MNDLIAARERILVRNGTVLRGVEAGAGPTILLLHAGHERRRVWTPIIGVLVEAGFRCVAFDQRGHGDSDGEIAEFEPYGGDAAAMLAAEPPGIVIVGASLGGYAALAALGDPALRARVSGLILVDTVPDADPGSVRRFLTEIGLDPDARIVADILDRLPRLRQTTAQLDLPVLLVRGGDRSPLTDDGVDALLRVAPHATVTRVPDAGHLVARDRPVPLARIIVAAAGEWTGRGSARSGSRS